MHYLKLILGLTLLLLAQALSAQQWRLEGRVTGDSEGLTAATVYVVSPTDGANIISFTTTDATGHFVLDFETTVDTVLLTANYLGYRTHTQEVMRTDNEPITITLTPAAHALAEVTVSETRAPITTTGDTTIYRADAFRDSTERRVADLLRQLPGVEVADDGQIKVQGRPIERLLIEGSDLFGRQYTIGSENLSADVIETVEVIEHYQENAVLRELERTDAVVLNLKLRGDAKHQLTGTATAAGGYGEEGKGNLHGTGFLIGRRAKQVLITSNGNTGTQYGLNEISATYDFDQTDQFGDPAGQALTLTQAIRPDYLNFRREFLDNARSGFGSYRGYYRLGQHWELRTDLAAAGQADRQTSNERTRFAYDETAYTLDQEQQLDAQNSLLDARIGTTYQSADANSRLEAFVRYHHDGHRGRSAARFRSDTSTLSDQLNYRTRLREQLLHGGLRYTQRLHARHALEIIAKYDRRTAAQTLDVDYSRALPALFGAIGSQLEQSIEPTQRTQSGALIYRGRWGQWAVRSEGELRAERTRLPVDITTNEGELSNKATTVTGVQQYYTLRAERPFWEDGHYRMHLAAAPGHWQTDKGESVRLGIAQTPSLGAGFEKPLSRKTTLRLDYRLARRPESWQYPTRYLSGPFELLDETLRPEATGGQTLTLHLRRLDPRNRGTWHLRLSAVHDERRYVRDLRFNGALVRTAPAYVTGGQRLAARGRYARFLSKWRTNFWVAPSASWQRGPLLVDGNQQSATGQRAGLRYHLSRRMNPQLLLKLEGSVRHQRFRLVDRSSTAFTVQQLEPSLVLDWLDCRWLLNAYYARGNGAGRRYAFWGSKARVARTVQLGDWTTHLTLDVTNLFGVDAYTQLSSGPYFAYARTVEAVPAFLTVGADVEF